MLEAKAIIERVRRISAGVQHVSLAVDRGHSVINPGQFFLARLTESLDPYLREPWTPIHIETRAQNAIITFERPGNRTYEPGQVISLIGPVGKAIPLPETLRTLLLIAFDATPASLLLLAETALKHKVSVALALVGNAVHYPLEALPQEIEIIRAEKSPWLNQDVTIKWANQVVAVAAPPYDITHYADLVDILRKVRIEIAPKYSYGLFQPPMPCGIGTCMACLIRCGSEELAACLEGPAFDLLTVTLVRPGEKFND